MDAIQSFASSVKVATPYDQVYKNECVYTYHTPLTRNDDKNKGGIVVNLQTHIGTIQEMALSSNEPERGIFLRIVQERTRKTVPGESSNASEGTPPSAAAAPTKLAIGVEGGFANPDDKYEIKSHYSVVVLQRSNTNDDNYTNQSVVVVEEEVPFTEDTRNDFPMAVTQAVDAIINHVGVATQQDVKAWQMDEEIPVSKYANDNLPYVDNGVLIDPNPKTWKCAASGDTENLWLNLSDGYIGGGRKHWDGSGGSNGALDHFNETGQKYPLVVKLGTITADIDTADCYSYGMLIFAWVCSRVCCM
jgi:ubiquitin carboxyl-terminal hydrolase 5/13